MRDRSGHGGACGAPLRRHVRVLPVLLLFRRADTDAVVHSDFSPGGSSGVAPTTVEEPTRPPTARVAQRTGGAVWRSHGPTVAVLPPSTQPSKDVTESAIEWPEVSRRRSGASGDS